MVSVDELQEKVHEFEDYTQSMSVTLVVECMDDEAAVIEAIHKTLAAEAAIEVTAVAATTDYDAPSSDSN